MNNQDNVQPGNERNVQQNAGTSKIDKENEVDFNAPEENDSEVDTNFGSEQIDTEDDVEINPSKLSTKEIDLDRSGVNYNRNQSSDAAKNQPRH